MTSPVAAVLHEAAAERPAAVAVSVDGGAELTYGDWERRAGAAAGALRSAGIAPGDRVALLFDSSGWAEFAVAFVAVGRVGAVPMPLSGELGSLEVRRVLRHSGAAALVAPRRLAPANPGVVVLAAESLQDMAASGAGEDQAGSTPAEVLHVSRPLAAPVAVERSPATVLGRSGAVIEAAGHDGVLAHWWPVGAAGGQDALWAALRGVRVHVLTEFDAARVCALLDGGAMNACSLHPATAAALLETAAAAGYDLSGLRGLVLASGRVQESLLRRLASQVPWTRVITADLEHPRRAEPQFDPAAGRAPRPAVRAAVAAAWRRVLGAATNERGSTSAELGDGVQPTRVLRLVEDALDVCVPIQALLAAPTQDGLCAAVERALEDRGAVAPDDRDGPAPAAFSQEGMIWHECFAPGCQNLPGLARRFQGPLNVTALGRAIDEIVRRHQPLRSTFANEGGRLLQVVRLPEHVPLEVSDVSELPPAERARWVEERITGAGVEPFDLVDGPLFAPSLVRLAPDEHVLIIRTHHSVFDDWSVGVFRRQLSELYAAYSAGREPQLPVVPGFAAFAREQRRRLAGDPGAGEIEYWRAQLSGSPLTTQLPVQDPAAQLGSVQRAGGPLTAILAADDRAMVQALARRERTTVFAVMLAAFASLASRITGQLDLLMSTVVANRNRTELEPLIGCFTKKVPLRLDLRGDPTFTDIVSRTRSALLGSLAHQDLPFEAVVQEVLGARAQAHGLVPHLDVMVQGVTPRQELVLPAVDSMGFDTSARAPRAHFMAGGGELRREADVPWGAGVYLGTFVILSVAAEQDDVSCILRGAFDADAGSQLLVAFQRVLSAAAAHPDRRLSDLEAPAALPPPPRGEQLDGFLVDPGRVAAELSRCPGVREATARILGRGSPRLEADVVPASGAPRDAVLRACLWRRLPGYAWPAAIHPVARLSAAEPPPERAAPPVPAGEAEADPAAFETVLGTLWGEVLGIERCLPEDNYWQDFSFLEALARARDAGVRVPGTAVTRNRTLRTLATALAAQHAAPPVAAVSVT
ncbi:MAG TPA: condensation domain-containing protein [Candidatus Dormibacteraeota bacterium]